jgi:hypothetical protein
MLSKNRETVFFEPAIKGWEFDMHYFKFKPNQMKKKFLVWVLSLMITGTLSYANKTDGINRQVEGSFRKQFGGAREVKWENHKAFVKLTFQLNESVLFAYYSQNGDLLAVSRNILTNQLPLIQLLRLKKEYAEYWISDLFELDTDSESSYYITLENADSKLILRSNCTDGWDLYKRESKF